MYDIILSINSITNVIPTAGIHMPGMPTSPQAGNLSPTQVAVQQQHLQRAFLQSAVAQNIQIQQHLMAQNQALQQLLSQSVPVGGHAHTSTCTDTHA